jgi:hypothetical protein
MVVSCSKNRYHRAEPTEWPSVQEKYNSYPNHLSTASHMRPVTFPRES